MGRGKPAFGVPLPLPGQCLSHTAPRRWPRRNPPPVLLNQQLAYMDYEGFEAGSPVTNQSFRAAPWIAPTEGVGYTCFYSPLPVNRRSQRGEPECTLGLHGPCVLPGDTGCYLAGHLGSGSDPCSTHASRSTQALAQPTHVQPSPAQPRSVRFNPAQPNLAQVNSVKTISTQFSPA